MVYVKYLHPVNVTGDPEIEALKADMDNAWMLLCGIIVFLMQLGFCFLEAGAIRATSVTTILFKNLADCTLGALMWWICGYSFGFGGGNEFIGGSESGRWALTPDVGDELYADIGHFFISFTHMTTTATIVSGGVAERIDLTAYVFVVIAIAGFAYPVAVHWFWSSTGWLSATSPNRIAANGVLDYAGGLTLHAFGGCSALLYATMLGPRKLRDGIDVFSEEGQAIVAPHNKLLLEAGTMVLWFSWFAFNAGTKVSNGRSFVAANAVVTTLLSSAVSCVMCALYSKIRLGYYDIEHCCNAAIAGLVGITAGCGYVAPVYAIPIGVVSFFCYKGLHHLRMKLRIDDVIDAGAVHFGGGVWGTIATGLFADAERIKAATGNSELSADYGLFLGGGGTQFGMQLLGVVSVVGWCIITSVIVYYALDFTIGARVSTEAELNGLDLYEHKAYAFDHLGVLDEHREHVKRIAKDTEEVAKRMDEYMRSLEDQPKTGSPKEGPSHPTHLRKIAAAQHASQVCHALEELTRSVRLSSIRLGSGSNNEPYEV